MSLQKKETRFRDYFKNLPYDFLQNQAEAWQPQGKELAFYFKQNIYSQ